MCDIVHSPDFQGFFKNIFQFPFYLRFALLFNQILLKNFKGREHNPNSGIKPASPKMSPALAGRLYH